MYEIKDDSAEYFYHTWVNNTPDKVAAEVRSNPTLWDTDLTRLPGFLTSVQEQLQDLITIGILETISQLETKKVPF